MAKHPVYFPSGVEQLEVVKFEFRAPPPGVQIKRGEGQVDGGETQPVDYKQGRRFSVRKLSPFAAQDYSVNEKIKKKLQRINVEKHDEEQEAGQKPDEAVLETEAPAVEIMMVPDHRENGEADAEGHKTAHRFHQVGEGFRDLERDDQQRQSECEDGIAERLQPRHLAPANPKTVSTFFVLTTHARFA